MSTPKKVSPLPSRCMRCGRSGPVRSSLAGPRWPVCRDFHCSSAGKSELELHLEAVADLPSPSTFDAPEEYSTAFDLLEEAWNLAAEGSR